MSTNNELSYVSPLSKISSPIPCQRIGIRHRNLDALNVFPTEGLVVSVYSMLKSAPVKGLVVLVQS